MHAAIGQYPLPRMRGRVREGASMANAPKQPSWKNAPAARENARRLRRDMTDAERVIWNAVRAHRLNGTSFRRQKPIGPYIVDFVCESARLIIEIDGGQHYEAKGLENDMRRDSYLTSKGFRILRFNNLDVLANRLGVIETIVAEISRSPSLPSPASGGGEETGSGSAS